MVVITFSRGNCILVFSKCLFERHYLIRLSEIVIVINMCLFSSILHFHVSSTYCVFLFLSFLALSIEKRFCDLNINNKPHIVLRILPAWKNRIRMRHCRLLQVLDVNDCLHEMKHWLGRCLYICVAWIWNPLYAILSAHGLSFL